MQRFFLFRNKARRLCLLLVAMIAVGLPVGCSVLAQKERELVFRIEPGNASWFSGLPRGVEELQLTHSTFGNQQNIHAWWWPAADADAPALLYLHGVRWNLTGHLFRLEQLRNLGSRCWPSTTAASARAWASCHPNAVSTPTHGSAGNV